jgi:hypothetical protein
MTGGKTVLPVESLSMSWNNHSSGRFLIHEQVIPGRSTMYLSSFTAKCVKFYFILALTEFKLDSNSGHTRPRAVTNDLQYRIQYSPCKKNFGCSYIRNREKSDLLKKYSMSPCCFGAFFSDWSGLLLREKLS